jgi:subtilase family serine protease
VPLPDLTVEVREIVVDPPDYREIQVAISNIGTGTISERSIRVQCFVGKIGVPNMGTPEIDKLMTISLAPGQSINYLEPNLPTSGANVRVVVDVDNDVLELNEHNNEVEKDFY